MKKFTLIFSGIMIAIGVGAIIEASRYKKYPLSQGFGAGFFPIILGGVIIGLSVILIIQTLVKKDDEKISGLNWESLWRPLVFVICMAGFALLLKPLGLLLNSFWFVAVTMITMGAKWWKSLIIAAVTAAVIYVGFDVLLGVPFPEGILGGVL